MKSFFWYVSFGSVSSLERWTVDAAVVVVLAVCDGGRYDGAAACCASQSSRITELDPSPDWMCAHWKMWKLEDVKVEGGYRVIYTHAVGVVTERYKRVDGLGSARQHAGSI